MTLVKVPSIFNPSEQYTYDAAKIPAPVADGATPSREAIGP
jgi:hypothetical protein